MVAAVFHLQPRQLFQVLGDCTCLHTLAGMLLCKGTLELRIHSPQRLVAKHTIVVLCKGGAAHALRTKQEHTTQLVEPQRECSSQSSQLRQAAAIRVSNDPQAILGALLRRQLQVQVKTQEKAGVRGV
jgi:hypothetical protein